MLTLLLPGYQIGTPIYESVNSLVYKGRRERDGLGVILKILKSDRSTPTEIARYQQEYHIIRKLELDGVVSAYDLETYQNTIALVLEDFGGISLKKYLAQQDSGRLKLSDFLSIAIQIVEILGQVHAANVIHKDINPANILYNSDRDGVKLIDFGLSTLVNPESPVLRNPTVLEGTLPYMSPEQTGRMNCSLDYRSDFYSLGVTFYEMLLGQLPFESEDTMELVHCHIAQTPTPPQDIDPEIPAAISEIVMKLLAKTAEERYQSAWGIQADLVLCLMQLEATGTIEDVIPGENDVVNKFRIPPAIYGRDRELSQLYAAFENIGAVPPQNSSSPPRIERSPQVSALFVVGDSGIGKTALVAESYKPVIRHYGYFIAGEFENSDSTCPQLGRRAARSKHPYSALVAAFQELVRQLLAETESALAQWRDRLTDALNQASSSEDNLTPLVRLIPELQLVLGIANPLPEDEAEGKGESRESPTRWRRLLGQLARVFCHSPTPLVLFLDNLQWADADTLYLIEDLLGDPQSQSLLFVGAYRDGELTSNHPLYQLQDRLQQRNVPRHHIRLNALDLDAIADLVADTLQNSRRNVMPLAALIAQKTNGNPFFVREFLKTLDRERLLVFDDEAMSWQWDIDRINAQEITDNVLEFLLEQLKKLPQRTQEILSLGALMGMEFDLDPISELTELPLRDLFQHLVPALVEGLVQPLRGEDSPDGGNERLLRRYQFLHEQVQQAAYSISSPAGSGVTARDRKPQLHLQIGQSLLRRLSPSQQLALNYIEGDARIFELVRHWNLGRDAIEATEQRYVRARLNLEAARQARTLSDYTSAVAYTLSGIEALGRSLWRHQADLAFDLYLERTRANLLQGNLDRAGDLLNLLYEKEPTDPLLAELDSLAVACASWRGECQRAESRVRQTLARLGETLRPSSEPDLDILGEDADAVLETLSRDRGSRPADIIDRLLGQAIALCATCAPQHLPPFTAALLRRSQTEGIVPETALACAAQSICELSRQDPTRPQNATLPARTWATLAIQLAEASGSRPHQCWTYRLVASRVYPCLDTIPTALSLLDEAQRLGSNTGAWFGVGATLGDRLLLSFYGGKPLNTLAAELARAIEWCRKYQNHWALDALISLQLPVMHLQGRTVFRSATPRHQMAPGQALSLVEGNAHPENRNPAQAALDGDRARIAFAQRCQIPGREGIWQRYNAHLAFVLYLEDRFDEALDAARTALPANSTTSEPIASTLARLTLALCLTALYPQASLSEQQQFSQDLERLRQELAASAEWCPETFAAPAALVRAEWERLSGHHDIAIDTYDTAIDAAIHHRLLHFAALANELAAKFWLQRGKAKIARVYFGEAYIAYQRWGATCKVQQLDRRYGSLLSVAALASRDELQDRDLTPHTNISINYTRSRAAVLDVTTVMKAAQALSGEIVLDRLLDKLMELAIANAGATRGAIVLDREGQLSLEIVQSVGDSPSDGQATANRSSLAVEACDSLPRSALNYVARTSESVVLNDATAESAFVNDPYIQQYQPKSLLCAPIQGQGKLIGLLYLENNLTAGAFTKDRLDVLMLLCAQAAIALENSRLYANLKQSELRERERATQLRDSLQELQEAQLQLVQSEKMATLGQLVAGVAHEINNPVGFVDANLSHAAGYIEDLIGLLELYQEEFPEPGEEIEEEVEAIDLEFILKDLPQILDSMKVGTERIRQISRSLRTFSRADTSAKVAVNLHEGIDSTLMILKPRLKFTKDRPAIVVVKEYSDEIPEIECYAGQLNQVFMNIIANAIDAFDETNEGRTYEEIERDPNCITIQTQWVEGDDEGNGDRAIVSIRDNGPGMPEEVAQQVFDHLFTTKAVGKGTGLGLSIAHQIVVEKHGGRLSCNSETGRGTEFTIEIPAS